MFDRLTHLNAIDRHNKHPPCDAKDAASLIIIDDSQTPYRIFMGCRHPKSAFVPSKFVFPGGAMEESDQTLAPSFPLSLQTERQLGFDIRASATPPLSSDPKRIARGLALTAVRETFEETGLMIGNQQETISQQPAGHQSAHHSPPSAIPAKSHCTPCEDDSMFDLPPFTRTPWADFRQHTVMPDSYSLIFLARAITPIGRARRFDTRFFVCQKSAIAAQYKPLSNELSQTGWFSYQQALNLDIIAITRVILEEINDHLNSPTPFTPLTSVPFYEMKNEIFCQQWINIS